MSKEPPVWCRMTALTDHIAKQRARGDRLPLLALCPVRGCLSFAPVGRGCAEHQADLDRWAMYAWQARSFGYTLRPFVIGGAP